VSSLHFVHPWLLLLLVAVPILGEVLRRVRRLPASLRTYATVFGPALALALGVIALAEPVIRHGSDRTTVLAVDRSGSISPRMAEVERHWTGKLGTYRCPAPCRVVRFATSPNARGRGNAAPGPGDTDVQSALDTAIGLAPTGGRVAVVTDGGQTTGDLTTVAAEARSRGVAVDWVPLSGSDLEDAAVTAIHAPPAVRVGDTVPLTLTVHSTVGATAMLHITRNGGATASQPVVLHIGDNPLLLQYAAARQG
jgi:Ca-activated chloride channel homolog